MRPSQNIAPTFYPLLCALLAIKNLCLWAILRFYHKTKCKAANKALEQHYLKEFKAIFKNAGESELKTTKRDLRSHLRQLCCQPFSIFVAYYLLPLSLSFKTVSLISIKFLLVISINEVMGIKDMITQAEFS